MPDTVDGSGHSTASSHGDGGDQLQQDLTDLAQLEQDVQVTGRASASSSDASGDDGASEWQQRVLERPNESLRSLDLLFNSNSAYDGLTVLSLLYNAIEDVSPLAYTARTLKLLNLNGNAIASLPPDKFWVRFRQLSLLFLSGNSIARWGAMEGLAHCPKLLWLTVDGNPIMSLVNAREFLVNKLPSIKALNDHVVTDVEYIKHAGRSIRFGAQSARLFIGDELSVPDTFEEYEPAATAYISKAEATIVNAYKRHSPSVLVQRVVRGHLSRRAMLPRFIHVRRLVVQVQKRIRGYLFRRRIHHEFVTLVTASGQQELLFGPMDDALFMTGGATRGLKKLVGYVQQWRVKFRAKKQAIAVRKIRFWCQMVYQRYRYRTRQILRGQQEIFVYYTPSFEDELIELALRSVHRDPVLMGMAPADREALLRSRCRDAGVSVLRAPSQHHVVTPTACKAQSSSSSDPASIAALKKTMTPPLVRLFHRHRPIETDVQVTAKHVLQQDMMTLSALRKQLQQRGSNMNVAHRRAVLLHASQLEVEVQQRLVNLNRKILTACVQQQQAKPRALLSLCRSLKLRVRGHSPSRPERRKMIRLLHLQQQQGESVNYDRLKVFFPWSIDMFMQLTSALERALLVSSVSARFALPYEQCRQLHAALVIQSTWRATRAHCRRHALELTIIRAVVCLQRWWRWSLGLRLRLAFVRASLLVGGSVNSRTLFIEEPVYRRLSDVDAWVEAKAAMRECKEHSFRSTMANGHVEISLSPSQMALFTAASSATVGGGRGGRQLRDTAAQRCGAMLPAWMAPGIPEHFEESMESRDFDATAHLLVDHVHAKPTLIERELLLLLASSSSSSSSTNGSKTNEDGGGDPLTAVNPYSRFQLSRRVADTASRVMDLARKFAVEQRRAGPTVATRDTDSVLSFVRLTFDSVEEAQHRALVLLAATFDPITHSYARLFSIEGLVAATMLRHQWTVLQISGDAITGQQLLDDCKNLLQAELPSIWATTLQQRLPPLPPPVYTLSVSIKPSCKGSQPPPLYVPHRPSSPSPATIEKGPAPLHITESFAGAGVQPVPPPLPRSAAETSSSFSRHKILTDRLGKPTYLSVDDMRQTQLEDREYIVRDRREERERAMEALIVDKRLLQREHAAELAGIELNMHVKLQQLKYKQELAKLETRELVEREKMNERHRQLTRVFETSFVAQSGAMMRRAARQAVEAKLIRREETRKATATVLQARERDAKDRRQDAKSYCFVSNQHSKREVDDIVEVGLADREVKEIKRQKQVKQRIKEDKEIKQVLKLM